MINNVIRYDYRKPYGQIISSPQAMGATSKDLLQRISALYRSTPGTTSLGQVNAADERGAILGRLFSSATQLKMFVSQVSMHLTSQWRANLFRQIDFLYDPDEWEETSQLIDFGTFRTFVRLMLLGSDVPQPSIGVSPEGHILAAWRGLSGPLTIECLSDDRVALLTASGYATVNSRDAPIDIESMQAVFSDFHFQERSGATRDYDRG